MESEDGRAIGSFALRNGCHRPSQTMTVLKLICVIRTFVSSLQLPRSLIKKVLVVLHDSILPHMNEPTLMIDFLTVAYDVGG